MTNQSILATEEGKNFEHLVEKVLLTVKKQGLANAEVNLAIESGLSVTVRMGEVETVEFHHDKGLSVTLYHEGKKGSASTTDLTVSGLNTAVDAAYRMMEYTEVDDCSGLADRDSMATVIPNLNLNHPWNISPELAIQIATECENAARSYDKHITNSEGATLNSYTTWRVYGNSHGFIGSYPSSYHSLSCCVIAEKDNMMQRDDEYTVARDQHDLWLPVKVGTSAAQRALKRLGGRKIKTCRVPVLFSPPVAKQLWRCFLSAISGQNLYRHSSFLVNHLEKKIFPEFIHIEDQPHILKGLGSAPFDAEGMATFDRNIVEGGILKSYILNSYAARKLGIAIHESKAVHNLMMHATHSLDELLKVMGTGILVTELIGQGVNILTGDYSKGAVGFWVENGEIQYPVEEITVAGNLKEMFSKIVGVGNDLDHRSAILTGSVLLEEMTVAGH